jgi:catechol 2,3-dioxygenase-like lactoylglutathione lyase family enzyme
MKSEFLFITRIAETVYKQLRRHSRLEPMTKITALNFPGNIRVSQVRIARPTDQLEAIRRFYCDGLGLPLIGSFSGHEGYDGIMLGLPDRTYHLEFTQKASGSPCPAPSEDNLLVLYVLNPVELEAMYQRLEGIGATAVQPDNPYWVGRSRTYADPDGWRVVICCEVGV